MGAFSARLNPPAHQLGQVNAVMGSAGTGAHHVSPFTGALSVKFMVRGRGLWRSDAGVHPVDEGWFLILNDGQTYTLDIDGHLPRESFCPFFRRGFVEDIHRTLTTDPSRLLDLPGDGAAPLAFHENLHARDRHVVPALLGLRALLRDPAADILDLESAFLRLGEALLIHARTDIAAQMARVPASRPSTRAESHRRLARARDYLHAHLHEPVDLRDVAAHACLSPYHFHRQFTAVHGLTPHRYLTRLRLDRARCLLRDSELPVSQVALLVGFESPAAFTRRFTRSVGTAPAAYRASQLRKNGKAPAPG